MATDPRLPPAELQQALRTLPQWRLVDGRELQRELRFPDFARAFAFVAAMALHAEKADHHPDYRHVYNRVSVTLTTHDAGGITARDLQLAQALDGLYGGSFAGDTTS
jgi:4a-hydroxytetrahydrobiopterin dehydratase